MASHVALSAAQLAEVQSTLDTQVNENQQLVRELSASRAQLAEMKAAQESRSHQVELKHERKIHQEIEFEKRSLEAQLFQEIELEKSSVEEQLNKTKTKLDKSKRQSVDLKVSLDATAKQLQEARETIVIPKTRNLFEAHEKLKETVRILANMLGMSMPLLREPEGEEAKNFKFELKQAEAIHKAALKKRGPIRQFAESNGRMEEGRRIKRHFSLSGSSNSYSPSMFSGSASSEEDGAYFASTPTVPSGKT